MFIVKQNSAVVIPVFMSDANGNGVSGTLTVKIKKNNSNFATITPTVTADANVTGWYNIALTSSHTDTLGVTVLRAETTGALPQHVVFLVTELGYADIQTFLSGIKTQTDKMLFDGSSYILSVPSNISSTVLQQVWNYAETNITSGIGNRIKTNIDTTVSSRLAASSYTAPDNAGIASIKAQTDKLTFDANNRVNAHTVVNDDKSNYTLDLTQTLPASPAANTTGEALKFADTRLDATVSSRLASSAYIPPDNTSISAIKSQTDKMSFDASNRINAHSVVNDDKTGYSLSSSEHINIANAVWNATVRTLTSMGTLADDVVTALLNATIEGSYKFIHYMRLFASALLGKVSGAQTNTPVFRDTLDTKNRITMTVDNDGNRTAVTLDGS